VNRNKGKRRHKNGMKKAKGKDEGKKWDRWRNDRNL
jgi:hypothetical protein